MKKLFFCLFILSFFFTNISFAQESPVLYYGNGCPHCTTVINFLDDNDALELVVLKETYQDRDNAAEYTELCKTKLIPIYDRGVPMLYAEDTIFIGSPDIITYLSDNLLIQQPLPETAPTETIEKEEVPLPLPKPTPLLLEDHKQIPPVTNIEETAEIEKDLNLTLPILVGAAIVDAINPCAFAVLLILMTTVLASGNRKRSLLSGLSFSFSIFISYLLMGLGLYSIVATSGASALFMKIIGSLAIILGLFNLKDFLWYGKGVLMEVPLSWRPKMKSLIHKITGPVGAFLTGFVVSLFLLPCTSGPYIVIISMLGQNELYSRAFSLLVLYNIIFTLPMVVITIAVYFGMSVQSAEQTRTKNLKILHLIAGIIMLAMGIAILSGLI